MLTNATIELLEARGITGETASRLGWASTSRSDGEWLEIPYFRAGKRVGAKQRTLAGEKRFSQDKGSEQCFYNADALAEAGTSAVVVTEGEMDCAVALQCGYLAVSVPNGAPLEKVQDGAAKYAYLADLPDGCEVILATDGDDQGANLLHDLALRIGRHRCKWVKYPRGCKDLNEAFLAWGERGVHETIRKAAWMKVDGLYKMSEIPPEPEFDPIPCTVPGTGAHYRLRPGDFTVITGIPSYGKSTFVNAVAAGMAQAHGWKVCFASFEQSPQRDHKRNLRTLYCGRPAHLADDEQKKKADAWIDEMFCFIAPSHEHEVTLDWTLKLCAAAVIQHGAKMIVLDPWNEMDHEFPPEMTLTRYTGFAIKQIKRFAMKYQVHVVVVAHPAKMVRNRQDGTYPVPTLYDISDSSHWYNKADIGIVVHRDEQGTVIKVAKCRYHNLIGMQGEVRLTFNDHDYSYRPAAVQAA